MPKHLQRGDEPPVLLGAGRGGVGALCRWRLSRGLYPTKQGTHASVGIKILDQKEIGVAILSLFKKHAEDLNLTGSGVLIGRNMYDIALGLIDGGMSEIGLIADSLEEEMLPERRDDRIEERERPLSSAEENSLARLIAC